VWRTLFIGPLEYNASHVIHAHIDAIPCECKFTVGSKINQEDVGPVEHSKRRVLFARMRRQSAAAKDFDARAQQVRRYVERLFSEGRQDVAFPGRWYGIFVEKELERIAAGRSYIQSDLRKRISTHLQATLDYSEPWATHLKQRIRNIMALT
jgi:hypothetical protein